jgi:hypothetical protein
MLPEIRRYLNLRRTSYEGNGEDYITGRFMLFTLQQIFLGDLNRKNEMGGACGM